MTKKIAEVSKGNTKPLLYQSRNWCFTDFELLQLNRIYNKYQDIIRYICWGLEICPKTKKKHYQGWIQFFNKKTLGGVKKILDNKQIHLEPCRGNEYDNDKYCKKDNNFHSHGTFITQGQRTDLEAIKKKIDDGYNMKQIADDHFSDYIRYHHGLDKYKALVEKEKTKEFRPIEVIILSGKTGIGKTKLAMQEATYKIEGDNLKWWDGYDQDKCILIDEYSNNIPITKLLNLLDGYQLRLEIKGSFTYANWNKVYITTNLSKKQLHSNALSEHREALFRRVTKFIDLSNNEFSN